MAMGNEIQKHRFSGPVLWCIRVRVRHGNHSRSPNTLHTARWDREGKNPNLGGMKIFKQNIEIWFNLYKYPFKCWSIFFFKKKAKKKIDQWCYYFILKIYFYLRHSHSSRFKDISGPSFLCCFTTEKVESWASMSWYCIRYMLYFIMWSEIAVMMNWVWAIQKCCIQ